MNFLICLKCPLLWESPVRKDLDEFGPESKEITGEVYFCDDKDRRFDTHTKLWYDWNVGRYDHPHKEYVAKHPPDHCPYHLEHTVW